MRYLTYCFDLLKICAIKTSFYLYEHLINWYDDSCQHSYQWWYFVRPEISKIVNKLILV